MKDNMADLKQSLRDFVATSNSGKYKTEQELMSKFPEFKDIDIQVLRDFVATSNSGKYKTEDELLSKFPEFNIKKKEDTPSSGQQGGSASPSVSSADKQNTQQKQATTQTPAPTVSEPKRIANPVGTGVLKPNENPIINNKANAILFFLKQGQQLKEEKETTPKYKIGEPLGMADVDLGAESPSNISQLRERQAKEASEINKQRSYVVSTSNSIQEIKEKLPTTKMNQQSISTLEMVKNNPQIASEITLNDYVEILEKETGGETLKGQPKESKYELSKEYTKDKSLIESYVGYASDIKKESLKQLESQFGAPMYQIENTLRAYNNQYAESVSKLSKLSSKISIIQEEINTKGQTEELISEYNKAKEEYNSELVNYESNANKINTLLQNPAYQSYIKSNNNIIDASKQYTSLEETELYKPLFDYKKTEQEKSDESYEKNKLDFWINAPLNLLSEMGGKFIKGAFGMLTTMGGTIASVIPEVGEDIQDAFAEADKWVDFQVDSALESTPIPNQLKLPMFQKYSIVDDAKVYLEDNGEVIVVTDQNNRPLPREAQDAILEKYYPSRNQYGLVENVSVPIGINGTATVLSDMIGAMSMAKKLASTGLVTNTNTALMTSYTAQMYDSFKDEAISAGMNHSDAQKYALGMSAIMSSLETIASPLESRIIKGGFNAFKGKLTTDMVKSIASGKLSVGQVIKSISKPVTKETLQELRQETLYEPLVQGLGNMVANSMTGSNLDESILLEGSKLKETVTITLASLLLMSGAQGVRESIFAKGDMLKTALDNPNQFYTLMENPELLGINEDRAKEIVSSFSKIEKAYTNIKANIPGEVAQTTVIGLYADKLGLESDLSSALTSEQKDKIKLQIESIDNEINKIINNPNNAKKVLEEDIEELQLENDSEKISIVREKISKGEDLDVEEDIIYENNKNQIDGYVSKTDTDNSIKIAPKQSTENINNPKKKQRIESLNKERDNILKRNIEEGDYIIDDETKKEYLYTNGVFLNTATEEITDIEFANGATILKSKLLEDIKPINKEKGEKEPKKWAKIKPQNGRLVADGKKPTNIISNVKEKSVTIDGLEYQILTDENGSITELVSDNGKKIKTESLLANVEILRNKLPNTKQETEVSVADIDISPLIDNAMNENITPLVANGIDKALNGERVTDNIKNRVISHINNVKEKLTSLGENNNAIKEKTKEYIDGLNSLIDFIQNDNVEDVESGNKQKAEPIAKAEEKVASKTTSTKPKETKSETKVEPKKEDPKEKVVDEAKQKEDDKHNKLVNLRSAYNGLSPARKNRKEGSDLLTRINKLASELGYTVSLEKGKISITNNKGKNIGKRSQKTDEPKPSQEAINHAIDHINRLGILEWNGDGMSARVDLGISWSDIRKGKADIEAGKTDTLSARRLINAIYKQKDEGGYTFIIGGGSLAVKVFSPIDESVADTLGYTQEELTVIEEQQEQLAKEFDSLLENMTEEEFNNFLNIEYDTTEQTETESDREAESDVNAETERATPEESGRYTKEKPKEITKPKNKQELADKIRDVFGLSKKKAKSVADIIELSAKSLVKAGVFNSEKEFWDSLPEFRKEKPDNISDDQYQSAKGVYSSIKNMIYNLTGGDVSTVLHEVSHWWLDNIDRSANQGNKQAKAMQFTLDNFAKSAEGIRFWKANFGGKFDAKNYKYRQELFARSYERYLYDGVAPTPKLKQIFDDISQWFKEIYASIADIDINLSDGMRSLYGKILSYDEVQLVEDDFVQQSESEIRENLSENIQSLDELNKELNNFDAFPLFQNHSEIDQIKQKAISDGTFMKAPNGKPTNLNEKQWLQVRTKAFKDWFGDWQNDPKNASKVVDENGEPMVVYHGTEAEFTEFEPTKPNFYQETEGWYFFTDKKESAKAFGKNVMSVFLNIDNPTIETTGHFNTWNLYDDEGNYGFIAPNTDTGNGGIANQYVVENPNQIKSATDNVGTFDNTNPNILFQARQNERQQAVDNIQKLAETAKGKNPNIKKSEFIEVLKNNPTTKKIFDHFTEKEVGDIFAHTEIDTSLFDAVVENSLQENVTNGTSERRYISRVVQDAESLGFQEYMDEVEKLEGKADRISQEAVEKIAEKLFQSMLNADNIDVAFLAFLNYASTRVFSAKEGSILPTMSAQVFHKIIAYYKQNGDIKNAKRWVELFSGSGRALGQFISAMQESSTPEAIANKITDKIAEENNKALDKVQDGGKTGKEIMESTAETLKTTKEESKNLVDNGKKTNEAKNKAVSKSRPSKKAIKDSELSDTQKKSKESAKAKAKAFFDIAKGEGLFQISGKLKDIAKGVVDDVLDMGAKSKEIAFATYSSIMEEQGVPSEIISESFNEVWSADQDAKVKDNMSDYIAEKVVSGSKTKPKKVTEKTNPLDMVANVLIARATEIIPESARQTAKKTVSVIERLAELIKNKEIAESAWRKAMNEVRNQIDVNPMLTDMEKAEMIAQLEDDISNFMSKPLPKPLVRKAVKTGAKDLGVEINKVIQESLESQTETGDTIAKNLIEQLGLDADTAQELQDAVMEDWNDMLSEAKERALEIQLEKDLKKKVRDADLAKKKAEREANLAKKKAEREKLQAELKAERDRLRETEGQLAVHEFNMNHALKQWNEAKEKEDQLRDQLSNETDPKKRKEIEKKIISAQKQTEIKFKSYKSKEKAYNDAKKKAQEKHEERIKILVGLLQRIPNKKKDKPDLIDNIMDAVMNGGVLDDAWLKQAFENQFGLRTLTPEQEVKLRNFVKLLSTDLGIEYKGRIARDFADFLKSLEPRTAVAVYEFAEGAIVSMSLSGLVTNTLNIPVGTASMMSKSFLAKLATSPIGMWNAIQDFAKTNQRGIGRSASKSALKTGYNQLADINEVFSNEPRIKGSLNRYLFNNIKERQQKLSDRLEKSKQKENAIARALSMAGNVYYEANITALSLFQAVINLNSAFDPLLANRLGEYYNYVNLYNLEMENNKQNKLNKTRGEILDSVREKMGYNQIQQDFYTQKAQDIARILSSYGIELSDADIQREAKWQMLANREQEVAEQAYEEISNASMMGKPYGLFGMTLEKIQKLTQYNRDPETKLGHIGNVFKFMARVNLLLFSRVATMSLNTAIKAIPLLGALNSFYTLKPNKDGKWDFQLNSKEDITRNLIGDATILATYVGLLAHMFDWDDEEETFVLNPNRLIDMTLDVGAITKDYKRGDLEEGYTPLAIRVRTSPNKDFGRWQGVKYALPIVPMVAMLGGLSDRINYKTSDKDYKEEQGDDLTKPSIKKKIAKKDLLINAYPDVARALSQLSFNQTLRTIGDIFTITGIETSADTRERKFTDIVANISKPYKQLVVPFTSNTSRDIINITASYLDVEQPKYTKVEKVFLNGFALADFVTSASRSEDRVLRDRFGNKLPRQTALHQLAYALNTLPFIDIENEGIAELQKKTIYQIVNAHEGMAVPKEISISSTNFGKILKNRDTPESLKIRVEDLMAKKWGELIEEEYGDGSWKDDSENEIYAKLYKLRTKARDHYTKLGTEIINGESVKVHINLYNEHRDLYLEIFPEYK